MKDAKRISRRAIFQVNFPHEGFPADWVDSSVPVVFDFQEKVTASEQDATRNVIWCLLRVDGIVVVVGIRREDFI